MGSVASPDGMGIGHRRFFRIGNLPGNTLLRCEYRHARRCAALPSPTVSGAGFKFAGDECELEFQKTASAAATCEPGKL